MLQAGGIITLLEQSAVVALRRITLAVTRSPFTKSIVCKRRRDRKTLEALIRTVIAHAGGLTDSIDENGVQEDHKLGRLLYNPKAEEIFGEDLVFDLRTLLIEKVGTNLRNRFSHGLMSDGHFYNQEAIYTWYLALRIAFSLRSVPAA